MLNRFILGVACIGSTQSMGNPLLRYFAGVGASSLARSFLPLPVSRVLESTFIFSYCGGAEAGKFVEILKKMAQFHALASTVQALGYHVLPKALQELGHEPRWGEPFVNVALAFALAQGPKIVNFFNGGRKASNIWGPRAEKEDSESYFLVKEERRVFVKGRGAEKNEEQLDPELEKLEELLKALKTPLERNAQPYACVEELEEEGEKILRGEASEDKVSQEAASKERVPPELEGGDQANGGDLLDKGRKSSNQETD